jgi:hypothetical protein
LKSAKIITSVSPYYTNKISTYTRVKGQTLYNGFFEEEFINQPKMPLFKELTFTYNGTLYPTQNIEIFILGFLKAIDVLKASKIELILYFPGLAFKPDQAERVVKLMTGFEDNYIITNRIPRNEILQIQQKSHVLLMFPHNNIKGIPSSKLYEYIGLGKTILLSPSDNDIIENTILETHSGVVCKTSEQVCNYIIKLAKNYVDFKSGSSNENRLFYSRRYQTKKLAQILADLF